MKIWSLTRIVFCWEISNWGKSLRDFLTILSAIFDEIRLQSTILLFWESKLKNNIFFLFKNTVKSLIERSWAINSIKLSICTLLAPSTSEGFPRAWLPSITQSAQIIAFMILRPPSPTHRAKGGETRKLDPFNFKILKEWNFYCLWKSKE